MTLEVKEVEALGKIAKYNKSLYLLLPKDVAKKYGLKRGETFKITVEVTGEGTDVTYHFPRTAI